MKKIAYIILLGLVLAGCRDDLDLRQGNGSLPAELQEYFFILGDGSSSTRAVSYIDDEKSVFNGGDVLGCFALEDSGDGKVRQVAGTKPNARYEVMVVASSNSEVDGRRVLLPESSDDDLGRTHAKYLFYYPYNEKVKSIDDLRKLKHTVAADQKEKEAYEASDLLWDVAVPSGGLCKVEMDHAMANIVIMIDGVEYDASRGATVLQQPVTAENVNLTAPDIASMRDAAGNYFYMVGEKSERKDIEAHYAEYSSSNDRFRAAVPANRTIKAGTELIRLYSRIDGREKKFKLKKDVTLEPGKNYIFTLIKKGDPMPDVTDDDSWVLDVLDPETGEVVGLLCREYLHYQPNNPNQDFPTVPDDGTGTPRISSQAWVFYNLQPGTKIPELSVGHVLRFIYDVRINRGQEHVDDPTVNGWDHGFAWPEPHKFYSLGTGQGSADFGYGMFLADHGHKWVIDQSTGHGKTGSKINDYFMHGGTVVWNGVENEIREFIMPSRENSATNEDAKEYGHIAIPRDGNKEGIKVSFDPSDFAAEGANKVGVVIPHCLVDTRKREDGVVDQVRYPLVKIGFNCIWMSKSLKAHTFTDGEPLVCRNVINKEGEDDADAEEKWNAPKYGPSYLYPVYYPHESDMAKLWCDPYSSHGGDEEAIKNDPELKIDIMYNFTAFEDDRLLPKSIEDVADYFKPTLDDFELLHHYLGYKSSSKMMSREVQTKNMDSYEESDTTAFKRGKYVLRGSAGQNIYTANICGFNMTSVSFYRGEGRPKPWNYMGRSSSFWLAPRDYAEYLKGMSAPVYDWWKCWYVGGNIEDMFYDEAIHMNPIDPNSTSFMNNGLTQPAHYRTIFYTQVRFVLKFKNQKGGVVSPVVRRSNAAQRECRDVYIGLD